MNFTVPCVVQKRFQTCNGTSLTVTSNNLPHESLWSGHGGDSVQGFKFHGCLREREIADKRYDRPVASLRLLVWKSVPSPAIFTLSSIIKINRCSHRQLQYSEARSAVWPPKTLDTWTTRYCVILQVFFHPWVVSLSRLRGSSISRGAQPVIQGWAIACFGSFAAWSVL